MKYFGWADLFVFKGFAEKSQKLDEKGRPGSNLDMTSYKNKGKKSTSWHMKSDKFTKKRTSLYHLSKKLTKQEISQFFSTIDK